MLQCERSCSPFVDQTSNELIPKKDAEVDACHVGTLTEPDCLGPCEPGTNVTLEGIVWNETENGSNINFHELNLNYILILCSGSTFIIINF